MTDSAGAGDHTRGLWILIGARAVSAAGDDAAMVALLLIGQRTGASGVAAILIAWTLPAVAVSQVTGPLVDRALGRGLLAWTSMGQILLCLALSTARGFVPVLILAGLLGATQMVTNVGWQALVPRLAAADRIGRAVSWLHSSTTLGGMVGSLVGGLLIERSGSVRAVFLVDAASFAVLALGALAMGRRPGSGTAPGSGDHGTTGGWTVLRRDPILGPLTIGLLAFIVVGEVTTVVEVGLVIGPLHGSAFAFGALSALFGLAVVVGSLVSGRRPRTDAEQARLAVTAAVVLGSATTLAGMAPRLVVFGIVWAIAGISLGLLNASASTLVLTRVPQSSRGRALAAVQGASRAASLLALLVGGAAGSVLGPRATFVAAGLGALAVAVAVGRSLHARAEGSPGPQVER